MTSEELSFLRKITMVIGVLAACALLWWLREVLILVFAALVVSILFRGLAEPLQKKLDLPHGIALGAAVLCLIAVLALILLLFGVRIESQFSQVFALLPQAYATVTAWLKSKSWGPNLIDGLQQSDLSSAVPALMRLPSYAFGVFESVADVLLVLMAGIYFAAQPNLYRRELLYLLPEESRDRFATTVDDIGASLRGWLVTQLIAMCVVGIFVGCAMWLIGVPSPLALGLFAGVAEFVPIAGPIAAAMPALLLSLLAGPDVAGWTLLAFVIIQAFEGNILIPLLQQRVVDVPPAMTLFSLVVFALIFGPVGVIIATPLTVACLVLLRKLEPDNPKLR